MNKTGTLLDVPQDRPSTRTRLRSFTREHGILTFRSKGFTREEEPWIAIKPIPGDESKNIGEIMADSCRLYDEAGYLATGTGELTAVRKLCELRGITCEL